MPLKRAKRAGIVWLQEENLNSSVILWIICNVFKIFTEWQRRSLFKAILAFPPLFFISTTLKSICYLKFFARCCELAWYWQDKKKLWRKKLGGPGGQIEYESAWYPHSNEGQLLSQKAKKWREVFGVFFCSAPLVLLEYRAQFYAPLKGIWHRRCSWERWVYLALMKEGPGRTLLLAWTTSGTLHTDRARLFSEVHSEKIRAVKREIWIRLWKVVLFCCFVLFHQGWSNAGTGCTEIL